MGKHSLMMWTNVFVIKECSKLSTCIKHIFDPIGHSYNWRVHVKEAELK